jgi:hypothetical protein
MRSEVLYLVLVGVPLLGLLGILEAGERIAPPRSVGGEWEVAQMPAHEASSPCLELGAGDEAVSWSVAQSGTRAELIVRTRPLLRIAAEVRGDSLIGTAPLPSVSACPASVVRIRVELRESEGTELVHGILSMDDCAACSPTLFVARRHADEEEP